MNPPIFIAFVYSLNKYANIAFANWFASIVNTVKKTSTHYQLISNQAYAGNVKKPKQSMAIQWNVPCAIKHQHLEVQFVDIAVKIAKDLAQQSYASTVIKSVHLRNHNLLK